MIRVVKSGPAPRILRKRGVKETELFEAAFDAEPQDFQDGTKTFDFKSDIYGAKSVKNKLTLSNFEASLRDLLAKFEEHGITRVHLFAAIPLSVGIVIGKTLNLDVNPRFVIYEFNDGVREPKLEIGQ